MKRREWLKAITLAGGGLWLHGYAAARELSRAHEAFAHYERRFAEARLRLPVLNPALPSDRKTIADTARACLGIRDAWVPTIHTTVVRETAFDGGRIEWLRSTSWPGVVGTALLYLPAEPIEWPAPLVILACGHGAGGKLAPGYQRMARHVARCGAMVLCPDNLGQGERSPMGHSRCVKPFACGTSVQGLIVLETLGWVAWARSQARVDPQRLAAIGNSGGGTLTLFLAAFCPELAVLSSSGYPSTFEFIAMKEKEHCHCNILPGIVGRLEMWHLLGSFAPRPMFLFQGDLDSFFPTDLFHQTARKVRDVYRSLEAGSSLQTSVFPGQHSWDAERTVALGDFLARHLRLPRTVKDVDMNEQLLSNADRCLATWPAEALDTDRLAEQLTGHRIDGSPALWDVFPPPVPSEALCENSAGRGATRQILAQYEAFLTMPHPLPSNSERSDEKR